MHRVPECQGSNTQSPKFITKRYPNPDQREDLQNRTLRRMPILSYVVAGYWSWGSMLYILQGVWARIFNVGALMMRKGLWGLS